MSTTTRQRKKKLTGDFQEFFLETDVNAPVIAAEPLLFDYSELPIEARELVQQNARKIKGLFRQTREGLIEIGLLLAEVRASLTDGTWHSWCKRELGFSHDTALNFINAAGFLKENRDRDLSNVTLSALYVISRNTVLPEAQQEFIALAEQAAASGEQVDRTVALEVVRSYQAVAIANAPLADESKDLLMEHRNLRPVAQLAESKRDLHHLSKLPEAVQVEVVSHMVETGSSFKKARTVIDSSQFQQQPIEIHTVSLQPPAHEQRYGSWERLLAELPDASIDFMFIETPYRYAWYEEGGFFKLAEHVQRVLKDEGLGLAMVGHKAIQYVGRDLEDNNLRVGWTFALTRQAGQSPRLPGVNIMSSWVPMTLFYKGLAKPHHDGLIDDLVRYDASEAEAELADLKDAKSLERGVATYINRLVRPTDQVCHLVVSRQGSYGLEAYVRLAAREKGAASCLTLLGDEHLKEN